MRVMGRQDHILAKKEYLRYQSILDSLFPAGGDPYFANVISLLHFDNNFTDVKGKVWTQHDPGISFGAAKFGAASVNFDTFEYLDSPNSTDWDFGTGDFTIEMWLYPTTIGGSNRSIIGKESGGNTAFFLYMDTTGRPIFTWRNSADQTRLAYTAAGVVMTVNNYHHVAVVRNGAELAVYLNGTKGAIVANVSTESQKVYTAPTFIGYGSGVNAFNGYIDDLRVTKGVARYTTNFTIPAEVFPDA
jgi:hypothetical protein